MSFKSPWIFIVLIGLAFSHEPRIQIQFSLVPPVGTGPDSQGNIEGKVKGLDSPSKYKIVLYAHTNRWYVQPLESNPYTDLASDGKWSNWTHLGNRYAALVVSPNFKPEMHPMALPDVDGKQVIAKGEVAASSN